MLTITAGEDKPGRWWRHASPYLVLCILFVVLTWPVLFSGQGGDATLASALQDQFHLPVIRTMISQWPKVDIINYNAAQAPGYHLFLSFVGVSISDNVTTLKFVSNLFSLGLLLTVFHYARGYAGPWLAMVFVLPLLGSRYFLDSAIWLSSENTALLFACLALGGLVFHVATPLRNLQWGLWAMLAVAVRQNYIFLAIPIGLAGLLSSSFGHRAAQLMRAQVATLGPRRSWTNFGASLISIAMPLVLLLVLFIVWNGLVPPKFQEYHRGPNLAIIPIGLSLIGSFGFFYLPLLLPQLRLLRLADKSLWVVILGGLVISLMWPTSFDFEAGSSGGVIWELVKRTPALGNRSVILVPLTIGGAVILFLMWRSASTVGRGHPAALLVAAIFAFLLALSANHFAYQRYAEPTILVALVWLVSLTMTSATSGVVDASKIRFVYLGPALLGAIQFLQASALLYRRVLFDG